MFIMFDCYTERQEKEGEIKSECRVYLFINYYYYLVLSSENATYALLILQTWNKGRYKLYS